MKLETRSRSTSRATLNRQEDEPVSVAIAGWFAANARKLPWRTPGAEAGLGRDPYHALVAEAMLQQTQVSRVVEKYGPFIERFPTAAALAAADLDEVLALWSGLGYYRRARNLHAAARLVVERFGGRVPSDVEQLLELPGVGRYTAGAIASIAFDLPEPIVDGNVTRVLLRIHGREAASDDRTIQPWLWERAAALAAAARSPAAFNEGLMELGATVCLPPPASPACERCPVAAGCRARQAGKQLTIPLPKAAAARTDVFCASIVVVRSDGAVLIEKRPESGMWAGLWQTPTIERADRLPTKSEIARAVGIDPRSTKPDGGFEFLATHRRLVFAVFRTSVASAFEPRRGEFIPRARATRLALSSPQKKLITGESDLF